MLWPNKASLNISYFTIIWINKMQYQFLCLIYFVLQDYKITSMAIQIVDKVNKW